jgi:alpha-glucosidase (family GH31 glycosyl hydrolase)
LQEIRQNEFRKAVSLGFYFPSEFLYGLPERASNLLLHNTKNYDFELFATDTFLHPQGQEPLYGSIPYITSASESHSAGVAWVNSAHTFVSIEDMREGKYVDFLSESGALELFVFASASTGSTNRFKRVQEDLAIVTGFSYLPPVHSLGFHFSKYDDVSSDIMIERN